MAFYYVQAARMGVKEFFRWTLYTRSLAVIILVAFVATRLAPWMVLIFWLGDLVGVIWTWAALRSEEKSAQTPGQ